MWQPREKRICVMCVERKQKLPGIAVRLGVTGMCVPPVLPLPKRRKLERNVTFFPTMVVLATCVHEAQDILMAPGAVILDQGYK